MDWPKGPTRSSHQSRTWRCASAATPLHRCSRPRLTRPGPNTSAPGRKIKRAESRKTQAAERGCEIAQPRHLPRPGQMRDFCERFHVGARLACHHERRGSCRDEVMCAREPGGRGRGTRGDGLAAEQRPMQGHAPAAHLGGWAATRDKLLSSLADGKNAPITLGCRQLVRHSAASASSRRPGSC